jgi:hypothetical protein
VAGRHAHFGADFRTARVSANSAGVERTVAVLVGGGELGDCFDSVLLEPKLAVDVDVELGKILAPRDQIFLARHRAVLVLVVS